MNNKQKYESLIGHERLLFLAGLPCKERTALCTKAENSAVVVIRKECIKSGAATKFLNCTIHQLEKAMALGYAPVTYTQLHPKYEQTVRYWHISVLEAAKGHIKENVSKKRATIIPEEYINGEWVETRITDLKINSVFRLNHVDKGTSKECVAMSDPFVSEGRWTISIGKPSTNQEIPEEIRNQIMIKHNISF